MTPATLVRAYRALSPRTRALILHDLGIFAAAFVATDVLSSDHLTLSLLCSAAVTAVKVTLRKVAPVPPA